MPVPTKANKLTHGVGGNESDESETTSNNLWVGNLSPDVTDPELMDLFAQHGALDSVTTYSSRSYAFVYFKHIEDARAAKQALQGTIVRGNSLKIEFARPAKPCRSLWVGGISPGLSKEELEEQFLKFGKIEDFRFLRDRNTAFVDYFRLEDAIEAMKNMNGKCIGGDQLRVDFLRSQPARREQWIDSRDGQFQGRNAAVIDVYAGQKRPQLCSQLQASRKGDSQPSNILWIGFPPSVQIEEQMLHNAMILFGEIEGIRSFHSRHCSFVEFRSVDEARRAKEGLQGRLFNDPRITILFASSDLAPGKDYPAFYVGNKGPRSEMLLNEPQFLMQMDGFGHNRPTASNNFAGQLQSGAILRPNASVRAFGQGNIDPLISGPELNDLIAVQKFQDGKIGPNWRRSSPPLGIVPSPVPGIAAPSRSATSVSWDVLDMNHLHRDPKRLRIDGALPVEDHRLLVEYGGVSPVGARITSGVPSPGPPDNDFIWRGVIAKGGTPVCHARCIPIGKGIGSDLPEVVNCSARTGLDLLTKHYADAIGFDIVFFLPDSEDDFASYTEFLRYLGAKNRAGVTKFDDGTTLFLVPPSEFLMRVLKVPGPERLYGVVLKFPPSNNTSVQQSPQVPYSDRQQFPPHQGDSYLLPAKEELVPPDYNRVHDDSKHSPKPFYTQLAVSQSMQLVPQEYASIDNVSTSQAGVTLTPELIATLTSFLPATAQNSSLDSAKVASSAVRPPLVSVPSGDVGQPQLWKHEHIPHYTGYSSEQLGSTYNTQTTQYQPYPSVSSSLGHPSQVLHGNSQIPDSATGVQQLGAVSSRPLTNYVNPSQSGQVSISTHVGQQNQTATMQKGNGVVQGTDSSGFDSAQVSTQPSTAVASSNLNHGTHSSQPRNVTPFVSDNPMQHVQSAVTGAGQSTQDAEADKNQRYQSTLQFAANLLLQIQQQQKTQGGQRPGNGQ